MNLYALAALIATVYGIIVFMVGLLVRRERRGAVPMALDLWTSAGLFQLCHSPEWQTLATVAAIIGIRHLVALDLRRRAHWLAT